MKISTRIPISIYNCEVQVVFTDNFIKYSNRILKKLKLDEIDEGTAGLAITTGEPGEYIIIFDLTQLTYNIIIHESSHSKDEILLDRVIELGGEPSAYLVGYLTSEILKFAHKKRIKIEF